GTRLSLYRELSEEERAEAEHAIRLTIPPRGAELFVNGTGVSEPALFLVLSPVDLETVFVKGGVERRVWRPSEVRLYTPRKGELAHLFELGLPLSPMNLPWHVDVEQRVPRAEGAAGP